MEDEEEEDCRVLYLHVISKGCTGCIELPIRSECDS